MSSILKALKKLEQEKVLRGERTVDLALDIHRGTPRRQGGSPVFIVVVILLLVIATAGAWVLITPDGKNQQPLPGGGDVAIPPQPVAVLPETSPVPRPAAPAEPLPAAIQETPVAKVERNNAGVVAASPSLPVVAPKNEPRPSAAATRESARSQLRQFAGLKLTGIVWQEEASSRMAIIDDLPVMVGTAISGATVVEILTDRVVLSHDGRMSELLLEP